MVKTFIPEYSINDMRHYINVTDDLHNIKERMYIGKRNMLYSEHVGCPDDTDCLINLISKQKGFTYFFQKLDHFTPEHKITITNISNYIRENKPGINAYIIIPSFGDTPHLFFCFDKTYSNDTGISEYDIALSLVLQHKTFSDITDFLAPLLYIKCDIQKIIRKLEQFGHIQKSYFKYNDLIKAMQKKIDDCYKQ